MGRAERKRNDLVAAPEVLDLRAAAGGAGAGGGADGAAAARRYKPTDPPVYDLYGVVNHMGGTGGGHYTAFANHHADGAWYLFDDAHARCADAAEAAADNASAYVLFYAKRRPAADARDVRRQSLSLPQLWPHRLSIVPDEEMIKMLNEAGAARQKPTDPGTDI